MHTLYGRAVLIESAGSRFLFILFDRRRDPLDAPSHSVISVSVEAVSGLKAPRFKLENPAPAESREDDDDSLDTTPEPVDTVDDLESDPDTDTEHEPEGSGIAVDAVALNFLFERRSCC